MEHGPYLLFRLQSTNAIRNEVNRHFRQSDNRITVFLLSLQHFTGNEYHLTAPELEDRFDHFEKGVTCQFCEEPLPDGLQRLLQIVNEEWNRIKTELACTSGGPVAMSHFCLLSRRYIVAVHMGMRHFNSIQLFDTFWNQEKTLKLNGHFPPYTKCTALEPLNSELFLFIHNLTDEEGQTTIIYMMYVDVLNLECSIMEACAIKGYYQFIATDPDNSLRFVVALEHENHFFYRLVQIMNACMEFGQRVPDDQLQPKNCTYRLKGNRVFGLFFGWVQENRSLFYKEFQLDGDRQIHKQVWETSVNPQGFENIKNVPHFWSQNTCFVYNRQTLTPVIEFYKFNCVSHFTERVQYSFDWPVRQLRFDEDNGCLLLFRGIDLTPDFLEGGLSEAERERRRCLMQSARRHKTYIVNVQLSRPEKLFNIAAQNLFKITAFSPRVSMDCLMRHVPKESAPFEGALNTKMYSRRTI
ncbi:hypothetical protein M3Y97_01094600 [Aphelenchoides bicaudatus]|nr:hypothetical protein M3Y97_01094600 [Aphelenchoides bicaudatus]